VKLQTSTTNPLDAGTGECSVPGLANDAMFRPINQASHRGRWGSVPVFQQLAFLANARMPFPSPMEVKRRITVSQITLSNQGSL